MGVGKTAGGVWDSVGVLGLWGELKGGAGAFRDGI